MKKNLHVIEAQGSNKWVAYGLICTAILAAIWGVCVVLSFYLQSELLISVGHIPFWMMLGSLGVLLNYIPIAKSKPIPIPLAGIAITLITVTWFCVDNFIETEGFAGFFGRLELGLGLLIGCYCLTHMSLLMLLYRSDRSNALMV